VKFPLSAVLVVDCIDPQNSQPDTSDSGWQLCYSGKNKWGTSPAARPAHNLGRLPTPYVHVVFTLPREIAPLALQNKKVLYDLLFRTSAETLLEVARDPMSRPVITRIDFVLSSRR
jgi:hypothetical protein